LGYPEQGRTRNQEARALAQQIAHPFSLGFALTSAAVFHQFCGEWREAQECVEAAIRLAKDQGFPLRETVGTILHGWTLVQQGQAQEGMEQLTHGLSAFRATGAEVLRPYFLALLAEAHGTIGQPEAGLTVLVEALTLTDTTSVAWYEAELYRLKGELLLQQNSDHQAEAESCFAQAIAIA
jgi:predicted ATPase